MLIPDFSCLWKQLDGPQASAIMNAIYQYEDSLLSPAIEHLYRFSPDNATFNELKFIAMLAGMSYKYIEVAKLSDNYFNLYNMTTVPLSTLYDTTPVKDSFYGPFTPVIIVDTVADLNALDITCDPDTGKLLSNSWDLGVCAVVKVVLDNMYYYTKIEESGGVYSMSWEQLDYAYTDKVVVKVEYTPAPDQDGIIENDFVTSGTPYVYFGDYATQDDVDTFIAESGAILTTASVISFEGEYLVWDGNDFVSFSPVWPYFEGGKLLPDRYIDEMFSYEGMTIDQFRYFIKAMISGDFDIGSLHCLDVMLTCAGVLDQQNEDFVLPIEYIFQPSIDIPNNLINGDIHAKIGSRSKWANPDFWYKMLDAICKFLFYYSPHIVFEFSEVGAVYRYNGALMYDGTYHYG